MSQRDLIVNDSYDEEDNDPYYSKPVQRKLKIIKLMYLLGGLSSSSWGRFGQIYYNDHNYSSLQIGILEGISPLVTIFSYPFWGWVADKTRNKKKIYLINTCIGNIILCSLIIPQIINNFTFTFITILIKSIFQNSGAILDSYILELLGTKHQKKYGEYRMYLAISWGIGCFTMGTVADRLGFQYNFLIMIVTRMLYVSIFWYHIPNKTEQEKQSQQVKLKFKDLLSQLFKPLHMLFLSHVFVTGISHAFVEMQMYLFSFLLIYIKNYLQASTFLCGLCILIQVIPEIPIFYFSERLINYFNHDVLIVFSMCCYICRVYFYTQLTPNNSYYILALELLHGLTFASCKFLLFLNLFLIFFLFMEIVWTAAMDLGKNIGPKFWTTTMTSLLYSCYSSLGIFVGSIIGGYVVQDYGFLTLYSYAGIVISGILSVYILAMMVNYIRKDKFQLYALHIRGQQHEIIDDSQDILEKFLGDQDTQEQLLGEEKCE